MERKRRQNYGVRGKVYLTNLQPRVKGLLEQEPERPKRRARLREIGIGEGLTGECDPSVEVLDSSSHVVDPR